MLLHVHLYVQTLLHTNIGNITFNAIANRNKHKHVFCYVHVAYICRVRERIKVTVRELSGICRFIGTIIRNDFHGTTETTEKLVCNARIATVNVVSRKSSSV